MTTKELKEIGLYAAVTMVLTVGFFSTKAAISQDARLPSSPKVFIEGMEASAVVQPDKQSDTVIVKLNISNPTIAAKKIDWNLNLVRIDFTGNPMSRVITPSDQKRTIESAHRIRCKIKANASTDTTWTWKIQSSQSAPSNKLVSIPSYAVEWQGEHYDIGKESSVTIIRFPASLAWAKNPAGK